MGYKRNENISQMQVLNLHSPWYIYFKSFSLKYDSFFSRKDIYLSIREYSNSLNKIFGGIRHQPLAILVRKINQIIKTKKLTNYSRQINFASKPAWICRYLINLHIILLGLLFYFRRIKWITRDLNVMPPLTILKING